MGTSKHEILQTTSGGWRRLLKEKFQILAMCLGAGVDVWWVDLVGVCDDERPLLGEVVIEVGNDLDGDVGLPGAWWADNLETQRGGER